MVLEVLQHLLLRNGSSGDEECSLEPEDESAFTITRYIMASLYCLLALAVLFFLVPLFRVTAGGKIWQKLFYSFVLLGTLCKISIGFIWLWWSCLLLFYCVCWCHCRD